MRRFIKRETGFSYFFFASLLFCSLIEASSASAQPTNPDEQTEKQREKFEAVKKNIEQLKRELEKTKSNQESLQNRLERNEREIQQLDSKTKTLKSDIEKKQSSLDTLNIEQRNLHTQKTQQESLIKDYINTAYRLGKHSEIRLVFNQRDPAQSARMLKYFQKFSEERREKVTIFVKTLAQLDKLESDISLEKAKLERTQASLRKQKRALAKSQSQRRATLEKLEQSVADKNQRLAKLNNDRKRLEAILNTVYDTLGNEELNVDLSEFAQLKGRLLRPTRGSVTNRFGRKRAGTHIRWQGLEFDGQYGSDIFAIHHGRVVFSDYLRGHGLIIIVDHGAGFMSLYAHASNLFKEIGDWVTAGEVIASIGDTGGRRNAALYFEIRHHGKPADPSKWLKSA